MSSLRASPRRSRTSLVKQGLYRKEAAAMVSTWSDSWFEEGTRLFYFMPQSKVDEILPLQIRPDLRQSCARSSAAWSF